MENNDSNSPSEHGWYKATIPRRFFALTIDSFLFIFIIFASTFIFKINLESVNGLFTISFWIYSVIFIWKFGGATIGKKLMKIQVVDTNYQPVSLWKAFLREVIGKFISGLIFSLGYIWAIWDKDRQAWHDKIAGTYVVTKIPNNGKNSSVIFILIGLIAAIPVIAILAAIVVLIINPLELTRRSRDAVRLSDFLDIQQTILTLQTNDPKTSLCGAKTIPCMGQSNINDPQANNIDGTGWVRINLGKISRTGVTFLPLDPVNDATNFYKYCSDGKDWEIVTIFESEQQKGKMTTDGGIDPNLYEVGSKFGLCQ